MSVDLITAASTESIASVGRLMIDAGVLPFSWRTAPGPSTPCAEVRRPAVHRRSALVRSMAATPPWTYACLDRRLTRTHRPPPAAGRDPRATIAVTGEVRVRVAACGVCRTDLHLAEGDLPPRRPASCRATRSSASSTRSAPGAEPVRARRPHRRSPGCAAPAAAAGGAAAGGRTCVPMPAFTGWDADGGYAEYAVVAEAFAYRLPDGARRRRRGAAAVRRHHRVPRAAARRAAAGRHGSASTGSARRRTSSPRSRIAQGATVHVLTRAAKRARARARRSARPRPGAADDAPPEPLDAAILFAPAGELVPVALRGARPGRHPRRGRHPPQRHPAARTTPTSCSGSSSCAASPPTRGPTARSSSGWLPRLAHPADDDAAPLGRGRSGAGRPGRRPDHRRRRARSLTTPARRGRHARQQPPRA